MPEIVPKSIQTWFEQVLGQIFRKVFAQFSSLRNFSKKIKKFSKFQPKTHKTVESKGVLVSSLRNFSKKIKKFSKFQPKTHKTVPKRIQRCFEHVLGQFFRKFLAQFSMGGRVFENFQKKKTKNFQSSKKAENRYQKCLSKLVLNLFWCKFFQKNCYPSVPWMVESSKIFKKIKKISKFQKCPKSFPKVFKLALNKFWGKFFEKFLPSFPWSVESSELFKKNQKIFQNSNQKRTKPFPKESKSVLNMFWGNFFEKFLSPVLHGGSKLRKFSKKSKKFQNSKNARNRSQKYSNVV